MLLLPLVTVYSVSFSFLLVSRAVIGLLTGHNTLRRHLHVMGLNDNPTCRKCGTEEETSAHILCECEALGSLRHIYLGSFFFFWTRRTLVCWVRGPSGTLLKEQGSYSLVQYWGHREPVLRPRCIGPGEGPYPTYHSILFF